MQVISRQWTSPATTKDAAALRAETLMPADKKRDDEIDWADLLEGINHLYLLRLQVGPMTKTEGKCLFRGKFSSTF